ncbi:hypothetical protein [Ehrlichia chaffeensis]|uniref:hypothetical protein n=1 Tax=Ehrlichia chaffeensis TaxID=945 RepID=UPI000444AB25|nr:hypothetical protein [Ehrlichia chaffeensis]AHX06027.1 hypothetical protein ECHJAX_0983 [Ehrlichia chaffeensis str. Jax]
MFELIVVITSIVGGATALFGLMAGSDKDGKNEQEEEQKARPNRRRTRQAEKSIQEQTKEQNVGASSDTKVEEKKDIQHGSDDGQEKTKGGGE